MSGGMNGKCGSLAKSTTPLPRFSLSQRGLLQRTCECHRMPGLSVKTTAQSLVLQSKCATCRGATGLLGEYEDSNCSHVSLRQRSPSLSSWWDSPPATEEQTPALPSSDYNFSQILLYSPSSPPIQPKLIISNPEDKFEQEADWIAEQVMRMTNLTSSFNTVKSPNIHRLCKECQEELQPQPEKPEDEEDKKRLHAKSISSPNPILSPDIEQHIMGLQQGGGQPLSVTERAFFEPRFGHNFSHVKIHTDAQAAKTARAVNARAFTVGRDIVFGSGQYQPRSSQGQRLLAHELTHVVQQTDDVQQKTIQRSPNISSVSELIQRRTACEDNGVCRSQTGPEASNSPSDSLTESTTSALASFLPPLSSLTPCKAAKSLLEAEALHAWVSTSWLAYSSNMFGPQTTSLWQAYLDKSSSAVPRSKRFFAGGGEIVNGFTQHHKSAEAEKEVVDAAGALLLGPASSFLPVPGATTLVPVTSVIPAAILHARINNDKDPMGLHFDSPATTIPGNIAGGIGKGGPPGNVTVDLDTRDVNGLLQLQIDRSGTLLNITPFLNFQVHDTIDFCPGALGGTVAQTETIPMSILEATKGRFGPIFAADVPFDVLYPSPGIAKSIAIPPTPTPIPPTPMPTPTPIPPVASDVDTCTPLSGNATGERILLKVNTTDFLTSKEKTKLDVFANFLRTSGEKVKVHGLASIDGPPSYNDQLSCKRGLRAVYLLQNRGVSKGQIAGVFKHGALPGPAEENRAFVLEQVGNEPIPVPPTPTPGANFILKGLQFTSDHNLMRDNQVSWDESGVRFPKPEWLLTNQGSRSAPISHNNNQAIRLNAMYDVLPLATSNIPFTLKGLSASPFLSFQQSGTLKSGINQVLTMTAQQSLTDAIDVVGPVSIGWSVKIDAKEQPLVTSVGHEVFVTQHDPQQTDTSTGKVTYRRMAKAVELTKGWGNDPHAIIKGQMSRFHGYTFCPTCAFSGNVWPIADTMRGECQAIVRFVRAVNNMTGIAGIARGITVYADPSTADSPKIGELTERGGPGMSDFPPDATARRAFLFDSHNVANNYEAALEFTFGSKKFYPGGIAGAGLDTEVEVLHTFTHMSWAYWNIVQQKWVPVQLIHCYRPPC